MKSDFTDNSLVQNTFIQSILAKNTQTNDTDLLSPFQNKTLKQVSQEVYDVLVGIIDPQEVEKTIKKCIGYQYIDEIYHLQKGRYIRWISKKKQNTKNNNTSHSLTNGAIVLDVKFLDSGTHILCKNNMGKMIQLKMDDCILFQKLSTTELLILTANEEMQKNAHV